MSDKITLNSGTGGADVIAENITGNSFMPVSKIHTGALDADGGPVTTTNPIPVEISDGTNVLGTTAHPVKTDGSATTQPVSNSALTSIDGKLPAQGQALAAASVPVVLPAAQITTLTPPAAITGFATSAKQDTGNTSIASVDTKTPALGQALAAASVPVVLPAAHVTSLTPPAAITGFALDATVGTTNTEIGGVTETAPATDTASSGLNGRLQRIAQRLTTMITALGSPFQAGGSIGNTTFASTVADGSDVALGAVADASVTAGATGTISAKLRRISADIGSLVTGTVLAAGTALIGAVSSALRTDSIMNGTTSLVPKFAFATLSSTGSVVALVSNKKIRVLRYSVMADAACTVYFRTITTTTQLSGSKYIAANGGAGGTFCPVGHFETVAGEALGLVITGTANVSCDVSYVEV